MIYMYHCKALYLYIREHEIIIYMYIQKALISYYCAYILCKHQASTVIWLLLLIT